jgi:hypothetical protein
MSTACADTVGAEIGEDERRHTLDGVRRMGAA